LNSESLGDWRRTHYSSEILPDLDGEKVTIFGWVEEIRDLGGLKFFVLRDKEGVIQIAVHSEDVDDTVSTRISGLNKQSVIGVKGTVKKMLKAPQGAEITPEKIKILASAKHPLPLDPTGRIPAEIDVRLNSRILDLRRPSSRAIFRIRHTVLGAIREFLSEQGYIEIITPKIIASATEGGATLFPIAYFDREAFLAQSPQLYKEQLISDFEKVFEIGPIFRAEQSKTRRHLSEATSIDIEEAFVNYDDVMKTLENLICYVLKNVKSECRSELEILNEKFTIPKQPFEILTYDQILEELSQAGEKFSWGEDISTPALKTLGKLHPTFYFIKDWPTTSKPFYIKPRDDETNLCEAFDLMYKWTELVSGGTRVASKALLIKRLKEQNLDPSSFEYHLKVFDYGMPPHAGWALGLERFMMMITGKKNIREVTLFPRDRFRLTP
jgi:nondiscriminating aspartyl-tRNA synthetase